MTTDRIESDHTDADVPAIRRQIAIGRGSNGKIVPKRLVVSFLDLDTMLWNRPRGALAAKLSRLRNQAEPRHAG